MALREMTLPIRFVGGLSTKEDDKHVQITDLLKLENGVFTRNGTIAKRFGYSEVNRDRIDAATDLPAARASGRRQNELIAFDEEAGYSFVESADGWIKAGDIACPKFTNEVVSKTAGDQVRGDGAELSGVALYAWEEAGGVYASVLDANSGRTLSAPQLVDVNGSNPRVGINDTVLQLVYLDSASNRLWVATVDPAQPTGTITPSILTSDVDGTEQAFDIASGGDRLAIAWYDGTDVRIGYIATSGVLGSGATGLPSVIDITATVGGAIALDVDNAGTNRVNVAYFDGTDLQRILREFDLTAVSTDTVETTTTSLQRLTTVWAKEDNASGNRTAWHFWDESNAGGRRARWRELDEAGTSGATANIRDSKIASEAFADDEHVYFSLIKESTLFTVLFVVREDGLIIGRAFSGFSSLAPTVDSLPSITTDSGGRSHSWIAGYRTKLEGENNDVFTESGLRKVTLDFGAQDTYQGCESGKALYIAGAGFLWMYDGESFVEHGFHYAPDDIATPSQGAAGGTGLSAGDYLYRFAYGWKNDEGELEWGPVSAGTTVTVTGGSDNEVTFSIPTYRHTAKTSPRAEVFIGVFRTEADGTATLFKVSSDDPAATGDNGFVANDPSVDTVSFVDEMTDTDLTTKEPLYTNGGILSNDPTPNAQILSCAKDRLFFTDPADKNLVRFSQERRNAYAIESSPFLQFRVDPFGGDITAIIEQDGAIIVFKEQAIYRFAGPGPTAAGAGSFSQPQLVNSDVGCTDQRLLAYTPIGIMFMSKKGIHLLGRDLQVNYVGDRVEKFTDAQRENQTFVDATLIPDRRQVRWLTSSGKTLMYDYFFNRWSTWTNHEGVTAELVDDVYYYIRNLGQVFKENTSTHGDLNKQVKLKIRTAWIKLAQYLQGFQHIWHVTLVGNYKSDHDMRVRAAYDYEDNQENDVTIDVAGWHNEDNYGEGDYGDGDYGGSPDTVYQMEVHISEPCEAVQFEFEDVETTGNTGASYELSEILITGGIETSKYVLAAERMG